MSKCLIGLPLGGRFPKDIKDYLEAHKIEVIENPYGRKLSEEELMSLIKDCDATLAAAEPYTKKVLEVAKKLKIIARMGVGYDNVDLKAATERGIYVTWTPIPELAYAMAEHTMALILTFVKRIPYMNQEVRKGIWEPEKWGALIEDLYHLTLGLLGVGRIGGEVAKRAKAFGMSIIYYDIVRRKDLEDSLGIKYVSFNDLLSLSDILSIHTPLTPETKGMINEEAINKMKRNAIIINTARGAIIDEKALAKALMENRIAGACLDVLSEEPPTETHVFYKLGDRLQNLILTPHIGYGQHTGRAMGLTAAEDVVRVLRGERPKYLLNIEVIK
ncbi:Hydroxypyruvate reductase [archaeon HR06]|nr:Hydroxypyruvate reductase [archaeon HR06]